MEEQDTYSNRTILLIIATILFAIAVVVLSFAINTKTLVKTNVMTYKEESNVDYKVYLKDNQFYEEKFIEKDKEYIADIIDYIDTTLEYNVNASKLFDYECKYKIIGTVSASLKSDTSKELWTNDYTLLSEKKIKKEDNNSINIKENIKIKYDEYNKLIDSFKKTYVLSVDANLKVKLIVDIVGKVDEYSENIEIQNEIFLNIPLSEQTINISMNYNNVDNKEVIEESKLKSVKNMKLLYASLLLFVSSMIMFIIVIVKSRKSVTYYAKELEKILSRFDDIIVNIKNLPDLDDINILEVTTFEELVDAQQEYRIPISFCELKPGRKSVFILLVDTQAWIYTLRQKKRG